MNSPDLGNWTRMRTITPAVFTRSYFYACLSRCVHEKYGAGDEAM